jgi:hypothetical protein
VPVAVAGYRHRVDREHLAAGGPQAGDQQAAAVSMATGIGSSALSPASGITCNSAANPAASSLMRRLVTSLPSALTRATS